MDDADLQFKAGDVSIEKLGGPVMKVLGVSGERVRCIWAAKSGSKTQDFKSYDLKKLDPRRPRPAARSVSF